MASFRRQTRQATPAARSGRSFFKRGASATSFPPLKTARKPRPKAQLPPPLVVEMKTPKPERADASEVELEEINRMIKRASMRLAELDPESEYTAPQSFQEEEPETPTDPIEVAEPVPEETSDYGLTEEPEEFNGVSSESEEFELLQAQLEQERRKAKKLEEKLRLIESDFEDEKKHLHTTVRSLKQEMHRTAPILENKFFSLSRQLRSAVEAVENLQDELDGPLPDTAFGTIPTMIPSHTDTAITPPLPAAAVAPVEKPVEAKIVTATPKPEVAAPAPAPTPEELTQQSTKKKKKLLITGGAAVAALMLLSAGLSWKLVAPAQVDDKLVGEYMQKNATGEVKGASSVSSTGNAGNAPQAQADVPFNDTVWETIKEPIIGVELQSPANAVGIIKSDNSLTFSRKTGYIFKIQRIETKLDLKEYWSQVQATSLNYALAEETFKGKDAYHLTLEDATDYPGNRYLVKEGEYIFDIWYATASNKFDADDIRRAEKMLETLRFTK